jgi:hypothetical protein
LPPGAHVSSLNVSANTVYATTVAKCGGTPGARCTPWVRDGALGTVELRQTVVLFGGRGKNADA